MAAGLLVNLNLEVPDTFRAPPAPLPYDVVLGCPQSTDSESFRETTSGGSFETLPTCEDLEESECKTQSSSLLLSPRKSEVSKLTESKELTTEEEDACPICLEEYDTENPKLITKCEHHFHLSCILEWMERSDTCPICDQPFFKSRIDKSSKFPVSHKEAFQIRSKDRKLESTNVIIRGKETIQSVNRTFELGFFSTSGESNWYLGIWYASIPTTQTRVWVANRENPIKDIAQSSLEITETGQLAVKESPDSIVWQSTNKEEAKSIDLLESGNLVLYSSEGSKIWQSFDFPTDTWLPEMNISIQRSLTSWKSLFDPSPGLFSLRLNPQQFNEFQLVYNSTNVYWSTGNWTGAAFSNVPQMTIRYIYKFHFVDPYLSTASFWYTVRALENGAEPPLTRFQVDVSGQLKQFTWSPQIESWNMFWSEPEDKCRVHGLCGSFGSCVSTSLKPCVCLNGFKPVDDEGWNSGDFTSGCKRESDDFCEEKDGFEDVGDVGYDGGTTVSFQASRSSCEKSCLSNCSCIGLYHHERTNLCKNVFGSLLNLRNLSSDGIDEEDVFYIRVPREGIVKKNVSKAMILTASIVGSIAVLGFMGLILLVLKKRRENMNGTDEGGSFPGLNLKVFTYKELNSVTRGFSEKLGHGNDNVCGEGGYEEKWFFPPWAARQIIEGNVAAIVDSRLGVAYNIEEAERLALVAIWCIQDEEQMRPSMGMVVKMLEGVVEVTIPPPPKLIQALVAGESYRGVRMDSGVSAAGGCSDYNVGFSSAGSRSSLGGEIDLSSAESSPTMNLMENQLHSTSSPLISNLESAELHPAPSSLISEGGDYPPIQCFEDAKNICFIESSKLWAIAAPIAFNIWCNYGINSFTNIFVGHIGDIELSAVAIALSVVANFSFGFLLGMASALETLCGQAFGAGQIELLGVYLQRSWIILFGACFALLPLYLYATPLLKLLGQEHDIAILAGEFTMQVIPQMFSLAINFPTQKFLQAQSKVGILAWIGFAALIGHTIIIYLFVNVFKWGTAGAAAAYDISAWGIAVAQVFYVVGWCKEGWTGLSWCCRGRRLASLGGLY
ncbi:S-locus glycoprotein [Corchorus olitorius]|uniref:Protein DETOXIFICATION n=1 Tax=Corchorus olitorius TaxID=93759 RepID=A0A1R3JZW8_9ROSI|nr:S-locus glycoprotein [Corchorus olitorius]